MEAARFWGMTPPAWRALHQHDRAQMLVHYREHHLRESHAHRIQRAVSADLARKKEH